MNIERMKEAYLRGTEWMMCDQTERLATIRYAMSEALAMRGQGQMSEAMQSRITESLDKYIMGNYPKLRNQELELVLSMGIAGELTRDTYVTGAAVMAWVRIYYSSAERIKIVDDKHEEDELRFRPQNSTLSRNLEAYETKYKAAYEYYQEHWTIFDHSRDKDPRAFSLAHWASMVYKVYLKRGEIAPATAEEQDQARQRAEQQVLMEHERLRGVTLPMQCIQDSIDDYYDAFLLENHYAKTTTLLQ